MAKERSAEKKERKEKKRASETNGVTKSKKEKKSKASAVDASEMEVDFDDAAAAETTVADAGDGAGKRERGTVKLVPFAVPMVDDKLEKKVMKGVKRSAKNKAIRRGVKEVVKAIRKSTTKGKELGVVVLAADISPWDVLSHIPVLCEDKDVKYVWVPSRAELGAAGSTKRPTSVVMICPQGSAKADKDSEWDEQYEDLWKAVNKASKSIII